MQPQLNSAGDLHDAIAQLAQLNANPHAGGITREVFTPLYRDAIDWTAARMRDAGMKVRLDAFGNLFGRWQTGDPNAPIVLTGSHIDTTLNAGRYDGVLGVLGAIEAVCSLRAAGTKLVRPIEVVAFAGEEPRFGRGCIGSRVLTGELQRPELDLLVDRDGVTLAAALRDFGCDPDRLGEARLDPARIHAFVELHIEQGAVLETHGDSIGVVTAIAAPHDLRLTLRGAATHAGATPMRMRRDALAGAAEVMSALERLALDSPSGTSVATVGALHARPGAINVVPGEVELEIDVRDSDLGARESLVEVLGVTLGEVAKRRGLEVELTTIVEDLPLACDAAVIDAVATAAADLGLKARRMISGAYHDALVLGRAIPTGMIFVPSAGGISHHPDEYTKPDDVERGVRVLARTLALLAQTA